MKKWLFNPFEMIAGWTSLFIGLAIILITAGLSVPAKVHLDGAIDLHAGAGTSIMVALSEGIIDWLSLALVFYLLGIILSKSAVRMIDVAGTLAMARFPLLITLFVTFIFPTKKITNYFEWKILKVGEAVELSGTEITLFIIQTLFVLTCIVWMFVLLYRSYTISCNLKGTKAVLSFIGGIVIAEVISKLVLHLIH